MTDYGPTTMPDRLCRCGHAESQHNLTHSGASRGACKKCDYNDELEPNCKKFDPKPVYDDSFGDNIEVTDTIKPHTTAEPIYKVMTIPRSMVEGAPAGPIAQVYSAAERMAKAARDEHETELILQLRNASVDALMRQAPIVAGRVVIVPDVVWERIVSGRARFEDLHPGVAPESFTPEYEAEAAEHKAETKLPMPTPTPDLSECQWCRRTGNWPVVIDPYDAVSSPMAQEVYERPMCPYCYTRRSIAAVQWLTDDPDPEGGWGQLPTSPFPEEKS